MIFVDTSFFFPLLSAHDRDHGAQVFEGLGTRRLQDVLRSGRELGLRDGAER